MFLLPLFLYVYTHFCEHSETVSGFICWSVKRYLQATRCGPPRQNQQKPQPVPGQTCQSAPSDPWGQSGPPEKTRYSRVLQKRKEKTVKIKPWVTVPCVHKVKHSSLSSHQFLFEENRFRAEDIAIQFQQQELILWLLCVSIFVLGGLPKKWILLKLCWSCVRKFSSSFWQLNVEMPRPRLSQRLAEERVQRWKQLLLCVHRSSRSFVHQCLVFFTSSSVAAAGLCCASRFL